jgi:hypothetical protein
LSRAAADFRGRIIIHYPQPRPVKPVAQHRDPSLIIAEPLINRSLVKQPTNIQYGCIA